MLAAAALIASLAVTTTATAQTAVQARAMAYGARENLAKIQTTQVEVAAPPAATQHQRASYVDAQPIAEVAHIEADACQEAGVAATLQGEMDRAEFLGRGGDPAEETAEPGRQIVTVDPTFPDENCVTATGEPVPPESELALCEEFDPSEEGAGNRCLSTELWNARGYGFTVDALAGIIHEVDAEAVARCRGVGQPPEFMTGARYDITGILNNNTEIPNQPLAIPVLGTSTVVTFWETNWDPTTNETIDGSDTVWVNGLHITTPTEDIILAHAEATADCPQPEPTVTTPEGPPSPGPTVSPPPGGFPRDITLNASKSILQFGKTLTLSGSVTPATEFQTPRNCVEGVTVTIRRDVVGPPQQFVDVGTVVTDAEGNFSFNFSADRNAQWLAFIDKDNPTDCALVASEPTSVLVRPQLKLKPKTRTPKRGTMLPFRAELLPCDNHPGTRVKLRREFQGRSVKIKFSRLNASCVASFRVKVNFKQAVFDATWPKQDDDHQSSTARPKIIRSRR